MKPLVHVLTLFFFILNSQNIGLCSLLPSPHATNNSVCSPSETAALLQLKTSMSTTLSLCDYLRNSAVCCPSEYCDEAHDKTESWKEGTDCCIWEGVTCDHVSGHVIGIDLNCSCISNVTLLSSSSFFSLINLQNLNLANNGFGRSNLLPMLGQFTSLTHLNLSNSGLEGQLPPQISHLNKLLSLDLSDNDDLTLDTHALKRMVENLTEVRQLFLDNINMSITDPSSFLNLSSSLTHLSLTSEFSSGSLIGKFPETIFRLPNLIMLNLGSNLNLIPQLPKSNWSGPLESLILSDTSFHDKFPPSIVNLASLRHLDMSDCSCLGSLPRELGNLNKLIYLDLSHNQINGTIPSSFTKLTQLQYLNFSSNQLQGPVPSSISNNPNLTHLDLSSNNFSGMIDLQMFTKLQRLTHFVLSHNVLSLVFDVNVSYKFPFLSSLGLSSCNISQIPTLIAGKSNSTLEFDFSNNKIQDIPKWIWDLGDFAFLNLSRNHLEKFEQPHWVAIDDLDLSFNSIQGPLQIPPPGFSFSISNNGLTGEIPSTICGSPSSLFNLDMSHNNLSGVIPPCIGNMMMSSLSILDLRINNLQGTIPFPRDTTDYCSLSYLSLSDNQIRGQIPIFFANCSNLMLLDLGNNNLYDAFPHWLGSLEYLQVLDLSSNQLYGSLEDSNNNDSSFSRLKILDVSDNNFSGLFPANFVEKLRAMKNSSEDQSEGLYMVAGRGVLDAYVSRGSSRYFVVTEKGQRLDLPKILNVLVIIDLSKNKFKGEIPDAIGELHSLIGLNLSHNNFNGRIPHSVGNLTNLLWLDLSSNSLAGEIPGELENLTWLEVLNLFNNQLVGPIPQGNQFSTFGNTSYEGNSGLCGLPLSKTCYDVPGNHQPPPVSFQEKDHELWEFEWRVVLLGFGSGLACGLFMGFLICQTGKPKWFVNLVDDMQFRRKKKVKKAPRRVPRRNW